MNQPTSNLPTSEQPIVFARDGVVFANSRDLAAVFGKNHRDVLRAIDDLIREEPSLPLRHFAQGVYTLPETGSQQHRCFDLTRDGFTLLAMGFTGAKALKWKLRYIEAFNTMEAQLRHGQAVVGVEELPPELRSVIGGIVKGVVAVQMREMKAELAEATRHISDLGDQIKRANLSPTFDVALSVTSLQIAEMAGLPEGKRSRGLTQAITRQMKDFCASRGIPHQRTPRELNPQQPWRFPRSAAMTWLKQHGGEGWVLHEAQLARFKSAKKGAQGVLEFPRRISP